MMASQELHKVMMSLYGREDFLGENMEMTIEHLRQEAELMHLVRESGVLGQDVKGTLDQLH